MTIPRVRRTSGKRGNSEKGKDTPCYENHRGTVFFTILVSRESIFIIICSLDYIGILNE